MWTKSFSKIYPEVKKEAVWGLWKDVNHWPQWDTELEYCKMESEFIAGSQFMLKPIGGPKVKITLSEVVPNKTFTDYCRFFGATMHDIHELEETTNGLRITNTITVSGPLRFFWVHCVAKKITASIPKNLDALVRLARSSNA